MKDSGAERGLRAVISVAGWSGGLSPRGWNSKFFREKMLHSVAQGVRIGDFRWNLWLYGVAYGVHVFGHSSLDVTPFLKNIH